MAITFCWEPSHPTLHLWFSDKLSLESESVRTASGRLAAPG